MNAKEFLRQIEVLDKKIDSMIGNYETLKSIAESTTTKLSGMPHGGGERRKMENLVVKMACLEENIQAEVEKLSNMQSQATEYISMLEDFFERTLLIKRYINKCSWKIIACELNCSRTYIYKKHLSALENLDDILQKNCEHQ